MTELRISVCVRSGCFQMGWDNEPLTNSIEKKSCEIQKMNRAVTNQETRQRMPNEFEDLVGIWDLSEHCQPLATLT